MDVFSKKKRSWIMGRIRSKNTKPEIIVRSILHCMGYRFSLKKSKLPGSPDLVLPKHRTAIFVHGCFWHRHKGCKVATMPKTRVGFWRKKFERNVARDKENLRELRKLGWHPIVLWECQVMKDPAKLAERVFDRITGLTGYKIASSKKHKTIAFELPDKSQLLKIAEKRADYNQ